MMKLGQRSDQAQQSYCIDSRERTDAKVGRCRYTREERGPALRQPEYDGVGWHGRRKACSTDWLKMVRTRSELRCTVSDLEARSLSSPKWDLMGGMSNARHDAMRRELGMEGGLDSVRFKEAEAASCEYLHNPDVCKMQPAGEPHWAGREHLESVHLGKAMSGS